MTPARKKICKWLIGLALAGLAAWLGHPLVFRLAGAVLVVEQPVEQGDEVLLLGGDRQLEVASALYRENTSRRILLIEPYPDRVVRLGILDSSVTVASRELDGHGVPRQSVEILDGECHDIRQAVGTLRQWLREHPDQRICALCNRFSSRKMRYLFDTLMPASESGRVSVVGLRDRRFSETDWWKNRKGCKALLSGYIGLGYAWAAGEPVVSPPEWDPDEYEASLRNATF